MRLAAYGVSRPGPPPTDDEDLVELGRALFFDKILSGNRNISCASCHHPTLGSGDELPVSIGQGGEGLGPDRELAVGRLIPRNAPPVFSGGFEEMRSMFWDSRVDRDPLTGAFVTPEPGLNGPTPTLATVVAPLDGALAAQALFPVTSPEEMRGLPGENELADAPDNETVWSRLMERLVGTDDGATGGILRYKVLFRAAFPFVPSLSDLTFGHAALAIAAYERTVFTADDTPFDAYLDGDSLALSEPQKRGALLFFGRAGCAECHDGPLLADLEHHGLCVPQIGPGKIEPNDDRGRALVTGDPEDDYRFRTPPLRGVALSGPWMHDGCFTDLEESVRHHLDPLASQGAYDASQLPPLFASTHDTDPTRESARVDAVSPSLPVPTLLTEDELSDLMAFLHALTDPRHVDMAAEVPDEVPSGLPVQD